MVVLIGLLGVIQQFLLICKYFRFDEIDFSTLLKLKAKSILG